MLVPVDFSKPAIAALRYAAGLALSFDAELSVLHVVEPVHSDWRMDTVAQQRRSHGETLGRLRQLVASELPPGCRAHAKLHQGHPVEAIVGFATRSNADLIVMATRGQAGMKRALIGSVAERVVRHAPCPVLVVR